MEPTLDDKLYHVLKFGDLQDLEALLSQSASPNCHFDYDGLCEGSPLHVAAAAGHVQMVQRLLEAGAIVDAVDCVSSLQCVLMVVFFECVGLGWRLCFALGMHKRSFGSGTVAPAKRSFCSVKECGREHCFSRSVLRRICRHYETFIAKWCIFVRCQLCKFLTEFLQMIDTSAFSIGRRKRD